MRLRHIGLLPVLGLAACTAVAAIIAEKPPPPLKTPVESAVLDITMRLFVMGDAGEPNLTHDADINAMLNLIAHGGSVPAALLIPGGVVSPVGLPGTCAAAQKTLEKDYLKRIPASVQIFTVPGEEDHDGREFGTDFDVAWREAYFDCDQQGWIASQIGWGPKACACVKNWHVPTEAGTIGTHVLIPATDSRKGFKLVTYDSQAAIEDPDSVARQLELVLDSAAPSQRLIVMAHHPLVSLGPHGRSSRTAQDLGHPKYQAYIDRFSTLFATRGDRIALTIFGHDHSLQYLPRYPPVLISGAGAEKSSVSTPPDNGYAVGGEPALAMIELHANGAVTVHLVSEEDPKQFEIAPAP